MADGWISGHLTYLASAKYPAIKSGIQPDTLSLHRPDLAFLTHLIPDLILDPEQRFYLYKLLHNLIFYTSVMLKP
jgi:hypothetical protein